MSDEQQFWFLAEGLRRLPVLKFALGLSVICAAVGLGRFFLPDVSLPALSAVVLVSLLLMALLIVISVIASSAKHLSGQAQSVSWAVSLAAIALLFFTITALVFGWPEPWTRLILPGTTPIVEKMPGRAKGPPVANSSSSRPIISEAEPATPRKRAPEKSATPDSKQITAANIDVFYYAKPADGDRVRTALRGHAIRFTERPNLKTGSVAVNTIVCTPDVPGTELQRVIRALRSAGIDIRLIQRSENQSKTNRIEILTFSWESPGGERQLSDAPLTDAQLSTLSGCPFIFRNGTDPLP